MANDQVEALERRVEALEREVDQLWKCLIMGKIEDIRAELAAISGRLGDVPAQSGVPLHEPV